MRNRTDATGFSRIEREEAVIAGERAALTHRLVYEPSMSRSLGDASN